MLDPTQIERIAEELLDADRTRSVVPLLTARSSRHDDRGRLRRPGACGRRRRVEAGHRVVGHKIGLTSKAMQAATGITEPDYGVIFDDMVFENGAMVPFDNYSNVRIEVELAFVLDRPLTGPAARSSTCSSATKYVVPALEILNSHIELPGPHDRRHDQRQRRDGRHGPRWPPSGGRRSRPPLGRRAALPQPDHRGDRCRRRCPQPSRERRGLAGQQACTSTATTLEAGEIILAGSFTRPMWVERGDTVHADYGTLGAITCRFD